MSISKLDDKSIFNGALEIDSPEARQEYLRRICGDDEAQRDRILALLQGLEMDSQFLEKPAIDILATVGPVPATFALPGTRIGAYKIREQLGEGGMGIVYVAEQLEPVRRTVALKVIKPGMDSKEVIARFEAERQTLAMMSHPNIARVLQGGMTDNGRPYFVMELVRGVPITEFCRQQKLSVRDRLELFVTVCQAVQHAHLKGIIHRDLKPSNVLVELHDTKAVPKVIDFGVAKAINQQLGHQTIYTKFSQVMGTPLYMSPEQAQLSGLDIDTRSDVYSLGVLLYELLTGCTPIDKSTLGSVGLDEMRRIILEDEPPRPSHRVSTLNAEQFSTVSHCCGVEPRKFSRSLKGELDWIVMRALEKDRTRRYETASNLAADIGRYLNDKPVLACPPSAAYRFRKYTKRHKRLLTSAALLAAILLIATAISLSYAFQAHLAHQQADHETNKALAAEHLADQRLSQSRVDFDRALKALDTIVLEVTSAEFAQLPGVEPVRDEIIGKALAFYDVIIKEHNDDPYARMQQAVAHHRIADIYGRLREDEKQLHEVNKSVAILEQLISEHPDNLVFEKHLSDVLFHRFHSPLHHKQKQLEDAERALRIVRHHQEIGHGEHPVRIALYIYKVAERLPDDSPRARQLVEESIATTQAANFTPIPPTQSWLSRRAEETGDLETAVHLLKRAIEGYEKWAADPNKEDAYIERWLAESERAHLASVYEKLDRPEEAEAAYRLAFENARQLNREYHKHRTIHGAFAARANDLAQFLDAHDREDEATALFHELLQESPDSSQLHLAQAHRFKQLRHYDRALAAYHMAVDTEPDNADPHLALAGFSLWLAPAPLRDVNLALAHAQKAREIDPHNIPAQNMLAELYGTRLGEPEKGLAILQKVLEDNPTNVQALRTRHKIYRDRRDFEEALKDAARAVQLSPTIWPYIERAQTYMKLGHYDLAIADYNQAEAVAPDDSSVYAGRASVLLAQKSYAAALLDYDKALQLAPDHSWVYKRRANLHFLLEHFPQALTDLEKSIELDPTDMSAISWIPGTLIAQCSDQTFRKGIQTLADRTVELNDRSSQSLTARAHLLLSLGQWQSARADLDAVVADDEAQSYPLYQAACLALHTDDLPRYREICVKMCKTFGESHIPGDTHFTAWTCALAPDAIDDYGPAITLARHAVEKEPGIRQHQNALGAVLMRAGQFDEAQTELNKALEAPDSPNTSASYIRYFLALTEHHLGRVETAAQHLTTANFLADKELADSPAWNRKLTIDMLRDEAEKLIGQPAGSQNDN